MMVESVFMDGAWVVDVEADTVAHGAKVPNPPYEPEVLPPTSYYDPELFKREQEDFWPKVWTMAGRVTDVAEVGDYFTYELGPESFIIVRSSPDEIKAFYNVCPHRGNRIAYNDMGHTSDFTCSFHSWQFSLDGKLKRITDEELFHPKVICDRPGLKDVRCEIWAGFVFINMNPDAAPLLDSLGVIPEHLGPYNIQNFRIFKDYEIEFNTNWKTAVDAFIEVYHVHSLHSELEALAETKLCQHDLFDKGHSRSIIPEGVVSHRVEPQPADLNPALAVMLKQYGVDPATYDGPPNDVRDYLVPFKRKWGEENGVDFSGLTDLQLKTLYSYHLFPNMTLNLFESVCIVQRWLPHATDPLKCTYSVQTMFPLLNDPSKTLLDITNQAQEDEFVTMDPNHRPPRIKTTNGMDLGYVLNQDIEQLQQQQRGIRSRAFDGMRFSAQEIRIPHYRDEIDRYISGEKG
jgi:phenylpropionate dioxygenase-like ring-hydroxylating dioxygenase large terminal subunit